MLFVCTCKLYQNSQDVQKGRSPKKSQGENNYCEIKGGGQEMAAMMSMPIIVNDECDDYH